MSSNRRDDHFFEFPYQNTGFDAEVAHAHTKRRRRGWCFCGCCSGCLLLIVLFILGIVVLCYSLLSGGVPLVVSEETTVIVEPLKSDGESVDFHEAIRKMTGQNVQPDENGFMIVWRGYAGEILNSFNQEEVRQQYIGMCNQYEIDPLAAQLWSLPPWRPAEAEQWLAEVKEGLDAAQIAAAKPLYFVPLVRKSESDLVIMSQPLAIYAFHEQLSEALRARAGVRWEQDTVGAWQDMLTSIRLFRNVTIQQAWIKELIQKDSTSLLTPASDIVPTLPKWTAEQLEQAIKDLESLPKWTKPKEMLTTMQFTVLDMLSVTNDLPGLGNRLGMEMPKEVQDGLQVSQYVGFDWNLIAKELNSEVKTYGDLLEKSVGRNLEIQFEQLNLRPIGKPYRMPNEQEWQNFIQDCVYRMDEFPFFVAGRSKLIGAIMGYMTTRVAGEMYRLQLIEESHCQALRLALALERFHREKGQYPDSLEELKLQPMIPDMHMQYERRETDYRIWNAVVQLKKE